MINPVTSLMNMEMQLYGGTNYNSSVPSFVNNYKGASNYFNPYGYNQTFWGYNNLNNTVFGQTIPQGYANSYNLAQYGTYPQQTSQTSQVLPFNGLSNNEKEALVNFYAKNLEPSESFKNAAIMGGVSATVMQNPRIIAHPWNYLTTTLGKSDVKNMFKDVRKNGSLLNKLWKENSMILEEAFSQMHRAEARSKSKLGIFRARYTPEQYTRLKNIMEEALKTGNVDEIAKATETLRHAYCQNGWIRKGWNKITKLFGKETLPSVDKNINDLATITTKTTDRLKYQNAKMTIGRAFEKTGGTFGALMGLAEIAFNWGKVTKAQEKDAENAKLGIKTEYGKKQMTQTITKGIANTVGWCIGETLGVWAWAKAGAAVGTALGPGIGTAIGAAVGFIGGSIGMWLAGKGAKAAVGEDVANKIEAENLAQTQEGQLQLVQNAVNGINDGQNIDPQVQQAIQKLGTLYA